jgi:hypothetical protein
MMRDLVELNRDTLNEIEIDYGVDSTSLREET